MQKGFVRSLKFLVVLVIIGLFVWFLVLSPMITFHNNEKKLEDAARRYFEINKNQLPTGERVKTLSLNVLYDQSYIKEDLYAPYSHNTCSIDESWVKVRKENGHYQYYVYLDCGVLNSKVDHKGPEIRLQGDMEIELSVGDEFEDPGIKSIVDDNDGKIDIENATIKGKVDSSKVGTYEIQYSAVDKLNNKTVVTRFVKVVKTIESIVKSDLAEETNYVGGASLHNYVRLSNMYFRIFGFTKNKDVILVAEEDVANVNFTKLEKWLDEVYMNHFTDEAKAMLVKSEFCNMVLDANSLDTKECTSFTKKRYAYIPSVIDVNLAGTETENFMKPYTISWVGNKVNSKEAIVTRNVFYDTEYGKSFMVLDSSFNYGVRPKIVIKGKSLVTSGDGSHDNPYAFGETKKAKGGSYLNTRYSGEYIEHKGILWRIVEVMNDGTTKVISDDTLGTLNDRPLTASNPEDAKITFNTKDKNNYAYYINNQSSKYVDTSIFVSHEVEAPIYKKTIIYGEEVKVEKYKMKISPPNMYDMFGAQSTIRGGRKSHSYWLINSSKSNERYVGVITDIGVVLNEPIQKYGTFGVRAVGYVKKDAVISNGLGTYSSPYKLK